MPIYIAQLVVFLIFIFKIENFVAYIHMIRN